MNCLFYLAFSLLDLWLVCEIQSYRLQRISWLFASQNNNSTILVGYRTQELLKLYYIQRAEAENRTKNGIIVVNVWVFYKNFWAADTLRVRLYNLLSFDVGN